MQISHHAAEQLRLAKRVMDEGGITVVAGGDTLITADDWSFRGNNGGRRHAA